MICNGSLRGKVVYVPNLSALCFFVFAQPIDLGLAIHKYCAISSHKIERPKGLRFPSFSPIIANPERVLPSSSVVFF